MKFYIFLIHMQDIWLENMFWWKWCWESYVQHIWLKNMFWSWEIYHLTYRFLKSWILVEHYVLVSYVLINLLVLKLVFQTYCLHIHPYVYVIAYERLSLNQFWDKVYWGMNELFFIFFWLRMNYSYTVGLRWIMVRRLWVSSLQANKL